MCLAIPGQIESIHSNPQNAMVEVMGVRRQVSLELIQDECPAIGDWVLIHVGFAMSKISQEHAEEQLRVLALLGEDAEAKEEVHGYTFGANEGPETEGDAK